MPLGRMNPLLFSIALVVLQCAFFTSILDPRSSIINHHPSILDPQDAQEKADLAKLAAQLKEKDAAIRRSAVEAIGQLNDQSGVDLLISALADDNQEVRTAAALALGQTGSEKGVDPLTRMLQSQRLRDR